MLRSALLQFAYANVLLAACAAPGAALSLWMDARPLDASALLLPAVAMFVVYTFDKVLRYDPQDAVNDPERSALIVRWRAALTGAFWVALVGGSVWAVQLGWAILALFWLPALLGVLYAVPFLPRRFRWRRLKDITGVKNLVVAVAWGLNCGLLPLLVVGASGSVLWLSSLFLGLRFLINTTYFDLGDLAGDREEGTQTLPVVIGFAQTRRLLHVLNAVSALGFVGLLVAGVVPLSLVFVPAIWLYAHAYLRAARDEETDLGFLCDVVVDGEYAVMGALALVGVALGL